MGVASMVANRGPIYDLIESDIFLKESRNRITMNNIYVELNKVKAANTLMLKKKKYILYVLSFII